jgi:hypothetical protein
MSVALTDFTEEQWAFLAVLDAFRDPVTIELVGNLAPLLPGPLINLLEIAEKSNLIKKITHDQLAIGDELPSPVRRKLDSINSTEHLRLLIDKIRAGGLEKKMNPQSRLRLMYSAACVREAAELEIDMAQEAFDMVSVNPSITNRKLFCDGEVPFI